MVIIKVRIGVYMLKSLLICNSTGQPFYSREFGISDLDLRSDPILLAGLISAISSIGRTIFAKEIATIDFGDDGLKNEDAKIVVISKDLFQEDKHVNFVFFSRCNSDTPREFRKVATAIFIEIKPFLRQEYPDTARIQVLVDKLIDTKYNGLREYCE